MGKKIIIVYKSVTGFTKEYAEMIAQEMDCLLIDLKNVTAQMMSEVDIVIFGSRMHAGMIDGLKKAKQLFAQSKASQFIVFATGAMPNEEKETIDEMWKNNFSSEELQNISHFYMQSGLRYEKMSFFDKMMMKVFCRMMKKKKNKSEKEQQLADIIGTSYDISSKLYIMPLVAFLKS